MTDRKWHWFQHEEVRPATTNVGPVLLHQNTLFLDTTEHIPQVQHNVDPNSSFHDTETLARSEQPTQPIQGEINIAGGKVLRVTRGGNAYISNALPKI
jgi:hypothetical protein